MRLYRTLLATECPDRDNREIESSDHNGDRFVTPPSRQFQHYRSTLLSGWADKVRRYWLNIRGFAKSIPAGNSLFANYSALQEKRNSSYACVVELSTHEEKKLHESPSEYVQNNPDHRC